MDYQEVVSSALLYADRADTEVANRMASFVVLAEARINRLLRTREQTMRIFTPTVENRRYYSLPRDYNGLRQIRIVNADNRAVGRLGVDLEYVTPEHMSDGRNIHGKIGYTITENQLCFSSSFVPGHSIELLYYRKVPPLTPEFPNNWMSDSHPDIYISALTAEISLYVKDYEAVTLWAERLGMSIAEIKDSDAHETWPSTPLVIRNEEW